MALAPTLIQMIGSMLDPSRSLKNVDTLSFSKAANPIRWRLQMSPLRQLRIAQRALGMRACRCSYLGARFTVDIGDAVGFSVATRRYEPSEFIRLVRTCERIRPKVFIDVGAYFGVYSCVVGARGLADRIVAIEPEPTHFSALRENIRANGLEGRASLFAAAAGEEHGVLVNLAHPRAQNRGLIHIAADGKHCSAELVSLDRLPLPRGESIAIKIDVEGYELHALRGARHLFEENSGYAQVEALSHHNRTEVLDLMRRAGWHLVDENEFNLMFEKSS